MGRISVVLASLLKPVDDTRMYEKLGLSISQTNKYDVNIIGFYVKNKKFNSSINLFPVFNFNRLSFSRIVAPFKYLKLLLKVKPEIIIVNSHDLLIVTLLYSKFYRSKFIYDVQENYFLNIIHNSSISFLFRYPLAYYVRLKERIIHPSVDHYLIAEEAYVREMPWLSTKGTIILNKYRRIDNPDNTPERPPLQFLFSGTISRPYGILECIHLVRKLHALNPDIRLKIIGYCPDNRLLKHIQKITENQDYIELIGGDAPVPHVDIIKAIRESSFGLVFYHLNKAIRNCFPTRIYEYIANKLPVIIQDYPPWTDIIIESQAGIINKREDTPQDLLDKINKSVFYTKPVSANIYWSTEEEKLLNVLENLQIHI